MAVVLAFLINIIGTVSNIIYLLLIVRIFGSWIFRPSSSPFYRDLVKITDIIVRPIRRLYNNSAIYTNVVALDLTVIITMTLVSAVSRELMVILQSVMFTY